MYKIFELLDLNYEGMEEVKRALVDCNYNKAINSLKVYFIKREDKLYLNRSEIGDIARYCRDNFQEEVNEIIDTADKVLNKEFVFRYRWDMERTNKPFKFERKIKWDYIPFEDEEWTFMLNRHKYWTALGQAYWLTGKKKYAEAFFTQIEDWIDNNGDIEGNSKTTWRTIEAGIRCENWIKSLQYFIESEQLTAEILVKIIESLYEHGEYIYRKYDNYRKLSNWGVLENHGLFILSNFLPELRISKLWREESIKRLEEEINLQVMRDGMHWEQSPMYHNEVLHCYMDTILLAGNKNIELPQSIIDKTKKMASAILYMAKPNHHQPMQSDSDDTDLRDMFTLAALLFKDGEFKFGAYDKVDFYNSWEVGKNLINEYDKVEKILPKQLSKGFSDSGNYYMRSSWDKDAKYLYFHCGTLGSGHGHADLLHFDLSAFGEDMLIDSGRYTYIEGNNIRNMLKSCRAHNTTMVDGRDFTEIKGSWGYSRAALNLKQEFLSHEEYDYVEGAHLGYSDLEDPVFTVRKILYVKPHYFVIVDSFYCKNTHHFEQMFHFNKGRVYKDNGNRVVFEGSSSKLNIIPLEENIKCEIEECFISKEYNKLESSNMLVCSHDGKGFTSFITILYPEKTGECNIINCERIELERGKGEVIGKKEAEAVKININNTEEHILIFSHEEICIGSKLFVTQGIPSYGKVVLIKKQEQRHKVITVKY